MMRTFRQDGSDYEDEGPWWRLDFTMVLFLMLIAAVLALLGFEFWHPHFGSH